MSPFSKMISYRLPVIALCLAIYWQSGSPSVVSGQMFPLSDKFFHFAVYGVLGFLSARCLSIENLSPAAIQILAMGFTALFGASDEIHQSFVPSRDASFYDFLADFAGALTGAALFFPLKKALVYKKR